MLAFGDERAGADDALGLDYRAVEDSRAHADQAIVGDRAAVKDRLVADRHPSADGQGKVRVAVPDRAVLEVGRIAQDQGRIVAAKHRPEPNAGAGAEADVADEICRRRSPGAGPELREEVVE